MKWLVCLLLALAVGWLAWPRDGGKLESEKLVESSRRGLDREWRAKPEGEMMIGEMEGYAAGLGDKELWGELGKVCDDWMATNAGSKRFEQPRLAIMLAREVGKRDGESGMKRVAAWLKGRGEELFETAKDDLKMEFQFLEVRVRVASYAGWVSDDPETAISRLIESRKNEEEDWPVVNQGFLMYLKVAEYYAMEEVLREGFRDLQGRDFERAQELFVEGVGVWVFDVNQVVESFLSNLPEDEWSLFLSVLSEAVDVIDSGWALVEKEYWVPDYEGFLSKDSKREQLRHPHIVAFSRSRPEAATLALRDEKVSQEEKKWLFFGMALTDSQHYNQLGWLDDERKIEMVGNLLQGTKEYFFGPLTGKENPGELDRKHLISVIGETSMSDKTRERLRELIVD